MIDIRNLSFAYNGTPVLAGVTLSIGTSERWAVIGRNGAGKSTLIRCIAGLEPVPRGCVQVGGRDSVDQGARERARMIAYVPQARGRALPYTVAEYVLMGRFPYQGFLALPSREDREIVAHALSLTDTVDLAHRPIATLSGGELQRVLIAGAVSQRPKIMLLDEPATFLDPLHQEMMQAALDRVHDEFAATILTVTHDVNVAISRYENVLAIVDGKVWYAGPTGGLLERETALLEEIYGIGFEVSRLASGRRIVFPIGGRA